MKENGKVRTAVIRFWKVPNYLFYFEYIDKKNGLCTRVFLKRGPVSRQDSEIDKI